MAASSSILLYLLKANGALLLLAVVYFGLLRHLTFFTLNRAYLVLALLFAAGYPALPVPALLPAGATPAVFFSVAGSAAAARPAAGPSAPAVDWAAAGVALYGAGTAVLLGRLLVQLLALARLRQRSRPAVVAGLAVRVLPGPISPFSFGRSIYLDPAQHPGPELAAVLRHERVHVRQAHTLDVLLAQLALAAAWCNPAAWLLRRALLNNLEFLADQAVLATGLDRRAYQYSLLRLSHAPAGPALVSHFTFPTLKNRIVMMNAPASSLTQAGRYLLALPLALGLTIGGGAALCPAAATPLMAAPNASGPAVYYLDGKLSDKATVDALDPKAIAYVNVLKEESARQIFGKASGGVVIVVTTASQNSAPVLALNKRVERVAPLVPATPAQQAAMAAARAYLLKTYPNAKVHAIGTDRQAGTAAPRYRAEFEDGGQTRQQYFDAQGRPVGSAVPVGQPVGAVRPSAPAAQPVAYLAAPALAYITKNYPAARLLAVTAVPAANSAPAYEARLAIGRRPVGLLFDAQGGFIAEVAAR